MPPDILGRLMKPDAADMLNKRKVYIALLIPYSPGAPEGFDERYQAYWNAVDRQVAALESRTGPAKHIFVEGVVRGGQAGLNMLERSNKSAADVAAARLKSGAVFESFEDEELFGQVVDWGRCLQMGFISRTVATLAQQSFRAASESRQKHLQSKVNDSLKQMEAALLLVSSNDSVQLPSDVERFLVSPPELDELERWVLTVNEEVMRAMEQEESAMGQRLGSAADPHAGHSHGPVSPAAPMRPAPRPAAPPPQQKPGGLWTPGAR